MTRKSLRDLFADLQREHPELRGWTLVFNKRMRSYLGRCWYAPRREIHIAEWHRTQSPEAEVRDTLLHEVAHALAPVWAGHGREWKRACVRIGARPQRCGAQGVANKHKPTPKWRVECQRCGRTFDRRKRPSRWSGHRHLCMDGLGRGHLLWHDRRTGDVFNSATP